MSEEIKRTSKRSLAKQPAKQQPTRRLPEPPRTSFNFVAETVDGRRRKRQSIATVTSVAMLCLFVTLAMGFRAQTAASSARSEADSLKKKVRAITSEAASAFKYDGQDIPGDVEVPDHLSKRIAQVASTLSEDIDPVVVYNLIKETTPEQIRIKSVSIQAVPADDSAGDVITTTTTSTPKETTTTIVPEKEQNIVFTKYNFRFSVSAIVPSYTDAQAWKDKLRQNPSLSRVSLSPPAGDPSTGLTINADFQVTRYALLTRQKAILEPISPQIFQEVQGNG